MEIAPEAPLRLWGCSFNYATLLMTWIVMAALVSVFVLAAWKRQMVPGRLQFVIETFISAFDDLTRATLGERGRAYLPFIGTIFIFVWASNMIGVIPGLEEPTRDLNTPLGLAVIIIAVVHVSAIVIKGFKAWLWEFFEPAFPGSGTAGKIVAAVTALLSLALVVYIPLKLYAKSHTAGIVTGSVLGLAFVLTAIIAFEKKKTPNIFMAPLNIVGEMGKSISLPFRLYGNIFGGAVIITVLSHLLLQIGLPPFLNFFFGIFVGTIQAFVFAMLALTYTAVAIAEE